MSRYTQNKGTRTYAYGFDPVPMGGYFFQVFDSMLANDDNEEGLVVNEGFMPGIASGRMLELMVEHDVGSSVQRERVALDIPI